jgi:hypothetical protein
MEYSYPSKAEFLNKLKELIEEGVSRKSISVFTPYPVHEAEELVKEPPSKLKYFTFLGAISGFIAGFAFTIYTALNWPLITGGKPFVSIPAYVIIAFELTILFGALASFAGFLLLAKLPSIKGITAPVEYGNDFVIIVSTPERP